MTGWKDERKKAVQHKRPIPQMPEGYYSGDKPNPNLRAFVEALPGRAALRSRD